MVGIRKPKKAASKRKRAKYVPPTVGTFTVSSLGDLPRIRITASSDRSPWTCPSCGRGNPPWAAFCDHGKAASVDDDEEYDDDYGGNGEDGREY